MELLRLSIEPANVIWTILLVLTVIYWLVVSIGALDLHAFDVDFDADIDPGLDVSGDFHGDADFHVDGDADANIEGAGGLGGALLGILRFFNIGDAPLMIVISVAILAGWVISILSTHYLGNAGPLFMLMLFMPCLIGGLFVAKFVTAPLVPFFREAEDLAVSYHELAGMRCTVISGTATERFGQIEIIREGAPIRVNARTDHGTVLHKGDEAVVVRHDKGEDVYYIAGMNITSDSKGASAT